MKTKKATYTRRVIEVFARGRYPRSTEARVASWLTEDADLVEKDMALSELWDETLSEDQDSTGVDSAYDRWAGSPRCVAAPRRRSRRARLLRFWQCVAASLLIALGVVGVVMGSRRPAGVSLVQLTSSPGETLAVTLSDGSEVLLNGRSSLVYPAKFSGDSREVVLIGEANFKVAKDPRHPFIVKSDKVNVTALGTEFNVKAYPHHNEVVSTLLEGKVRVSYGDGAGEFILEPSEQVVYDKRTQKASVTHPPIDEITAWQRGEIVFVNATLPAILKDLETNFCHNFIYDASALPDDRYTFCFRKDMSLSDIMEVIGAVAGNVSTTVDDNLCRVWRK